MYSIDEIKDMAIQVVREYDACGSDVGSIDVNDWVDHCYGVDVLPWLAPDERYVLIQEVVRRNFGSRVLSP